MVQRNGKAGFMGEHSMMDGMPAVGLCSHIFASKYRTLLAEEKSFDKSKNDSDNHDFLRVESIFGGIMPTLNNSSVIEKMVTTGECLICLFSVCTTVISHFIFIDFGS